MRAAKGGKKVIERLFVGEIDNCEARANPVSITTKQVVMSNRYVKKATRCDTRRIMIIIFSSGSRYGYSR